MFDPNRIEAVKKSKFIYLATRGRKTGKTHIVELWFAFAEGKIYLSHEGSHTDWMRNIVKTDTVGVRIETVKFDAKATMVGEGSSREIGKRALYEKYYKPASKEVIDDWFELSTVIELTPLRER
jgi:hypothetical protein